MTDPHVVIVGGGLAGLSTGCYLRGSGVRTTIIEHNLALGGVCTAWARGPYTIDGCIHWLTGGPFDRVYEELGILPACKRRMLEEWVTYQSADDGVTIRFTKDLDALLRDLRILAPADRAELQRLIDGARKLADLAPPLDAPETKGLRDQLAQLWDMRHQAGAALHFRASVADWADEKLKSPALRRLFTKIVPPEVPAVFLCTVLGYLERGWLSRPIGGTAAFRDALIASYERLGGEARMHATVDEILVHGGRATGVRLADGTILTADAVVSTASAPETALRLLGGRYGADEVHQRMATWKPLGPIVLASYGVELPLRDLPAMWIVDRIEPFELGGAVNDHLYIRISNDEPALAPAGHVVVQALQDTSYDWWATRGSRYGAEKDAAAETVLTQLDRYIPGMRDAVRVTDLATPLTYWNMARSWRGAFEGWMPLHGSMFERVGKTLGSLRRFHMAGQWVEPGGGVPTACLSGRQAAQLVARELGASPRIPDERGFDPAPRTAG